MVRSLPPIATVERGRKVFVKDVEGYIRANDEHVLTATERADGGYAETRSLIHLDGGPIMWLTEHDGTPSCYLGSWESRVSGDVAYRAMRRFYGRLKEAVGDEFPPFPELEEKMVVTSRKPRDREYPVEAFFDEEAFDTIVRDHDPIMVRVHDARGHVSYTNMIARELIGAHAHVGFAFASHLDMSGPLAHITQETSSLQLPQAAVPPLTRELGALLGKYPLQD